MACTGGCIGGPGTLINLRVTRVQVDKYSSTAANKHSSENAAAVAQVENTSVSWHTCHEE
jgi:iron only hydrogenase large subunit-like protein